MECQKATGFLKNAYYQGRGRYVNQITRLTIKFCKSSGGSRELRRFIETKLVDLARKNEGCAIYLKPRMMKTPVMKAEYLNGEQQYLSFHRMGITQVEAWIDWFLTRSGYQLYKLERPITTYHPTIQGIWTPFTFRETALNVAKFPVEEYGRNISRKPSATEQLVEIFKQQQKQQQQQHQQEQKG